MTEKWLRKNGFNTEGKTYVYFPADSYDVREELKEAGFRYSKELYWHIDNVPKDYAEKCIEVSIDEVMEDDEFIDDAHRVVAVKMGDARPAPVINEKSQWVGEIGKRISNIVVTLKSVREFDGAYGRSQVARFEDENSNVITWFTQAEIKPEVNEPVRMNATIKKFDTYNGEKVTIISRPYFKFN